jgi:hypothetical protein
VKQTGSENHEQQALAECSERERESEKEMKCGMNSVTKINNLNKFLGVTH